MITNREEYYSTNYILLELTKYLRHTYLSVRKLKPDGKFSLSRYYLGYSLSLLKQSLERNGVMKNNSAKLYFDLAQWKKNGITPLFSFNPSERKKQKEDFNKNYLKYMKAYSFAIDIDAEDLKKAHKDAKKIKKLLEEYKLPFSVKFSGGRGFHFFIDDKWFSKIKPLKKVILFGRIAKIIMNVCGLKSHADGGTFDDSIYDDRRIFKLPYSLNYKDGKEYVCLPLDDEQFKKFKVENMELLKVMQDIKIYNRGLLERNYGLSEKELKQNVNKFLKEVN